ncbi:hypothetical protein Pcinc_041750 [Petrolisthes cinctipes]|uniref:Uncharacterized protein n=1 Tax=Petrolisthes cinctipes TaxID=88211 RepID=A0AAE1BMM5_PETCI|nr:hypothetical protein Pcinc_041750 [Petrolisthes cinctipes]
MRRRDKAVRMGRDDGLGGRERVEKGWGGKGREVESEEKRKREWEGGRERRKGRGNGREVQSEEKRKREWEGGRVEKRESTGTLGICQGRLSVHLPSPRDRWVGGWGGRDRDWFERLLGGWVGGWERGKTAGGRDGWVGGGERREDV